MTGENPVGHVAMSGAERLAVYVLAALALAALGVSIYRDRFASPPVKSLRETQVKELGVDINSAEAWELALLPGIGQKLAERIIEYRQTHGPFRDVRDLVNVQGIGESMIERLEPYASVSDASAAR